MPEMTDPQFKRIHDTLFAMAKELKQMSQRLASLAEELHLIDENQQQLDNLS